jgi:serine/threonine protein phosphatase PrpC
MPITTILRQPIGMSERGKRANNEDSIYPLTAQQHDTLFIVCDGVGGAAKGNVASRLVCDTFAKIFQDIKISDAHFIETCLLEVEDVVEKYTSENPESAGMATTLTLAHFHENGVTVAHVGDSRIYQVRNGQIVYRSEDHSFVQDLVRTGIITPEEAATHPKRNVITRAVQGKQRPTKADVYVLQDIQADDYFFLCSDGILESVKDDVLSQILTNTSTNEERVEEIKRLCEARSRDNFSCYMIQIEQSTGSPEYVTQQPPKRAATLPPPPVQEPSTAPATTVTAAPPQYSAYKSDAVTVITPSQASKKAESSAAAPYEKSANVTVITPAQASKTTADTPRNNTTSSNRVQENKQTSSPLMFILYALFVMAIIGVIVWMIWTNEQTGQ